MPEEPSEAGSRPSARQIYDRVTASAGEELDRRSPNLALSAVAAGTTMGLSALAVAAALTVLGDDGAGRLVSSALYPLGFIAVIVGRQQLFTENTLFPVALVLDRRRGLLGMLRLWGVVLTFNLVGTAVFAWLAVRTPALEGDISGELVRLGVEAANHGFEVVFWGGVFGGWLIALVGWLVSASDTSLGQIVVIWALTFVISLADFSHSIAGSAEVLSAMADGRTGSTSYLVWLAAAVLGNVVGGVGMVALLNYGQVRGEG